MCSAILVNGPDLLKHKERLTSWIHVQPFLSVVLICSNTEETHKLNVGSAIMSVVVICSKLERTHILDGCLAILVGGSTLLKH